MSLYDSDSARLTSQGPGLLTALRRYAALVVLCVVVAAGLGVIAYGAYCFVLARYGRM